MLPVVPPIKVKKLFSAVETPTKAYRTDSGYDLYAYHFLKLFSVGLLDRGIDIADDPASLVLPSLGRVLVGTGIQATVGEGYEIQIRPRSGNALKKGITVLNTPGTIDEMFRGEVGVILVNLSYQSVIIEKNDRIAQMVVCPVVLSEIEIVEELPSTERSAGGFGSSGV